MLDLFLHLYDNINREKKKNKGENTMKKLTNGPTKEMIEAGKKVIEAKANTEFIREIVVGYQTQILKEMDKFAKFGPRNTEKVLDPKHSYLLTDKDYKEYADKCEDARKTYGLHVDNPEFCPLLVAENDQRKAERNLIEVFQPATGLSVDMLTYDLDHYKKFMDLTIPMIQQYI
jgi:hypothetical protein